MCKEDDDIVKARLLPEFSFRQWILGPFEQVGGFVESAQKRRMEQGHQTANFGKYLFGGG